MATTPSRTAFSSACTALRQCRRSTQSLARQVAAPARQLSTSPRSCEAENERPRWSYTPEQMKAPFKLVPAKDPRRSEWKCNDDPALVDAMYHRLLGNRGDKMLPEEIKWLAITHKSFDNGRRGFNTRLAYFGRQVLALEAMRSILVSPPAKKTRIQDPYGREPYQNSALENVDKLNHKQPQDLMYQDKMAALAKEVGLMNVMRWRPRLPENLEGSGITVVMNTCLYAIIGAISLHHGAAVAQRVARERILDRLR